MTVSVDQFLVELKTSAVAHPFGLPTETVYGLAAPIHRPELIAEIFEIKKRPFFDPLIVHVVDAAQAKSLVSEWSELAELLAKEFWPGPLTLVLPKLDSVSDLITSGLQTVGLRCPDHEGALRILAELGPLAAPSANRFGHTSPTTAPHVAHEFGAGLVVVEGGPCRVGIESTVLEVRGTELCILRPGAILKSDIQTALSGEQFTFVNRPNEVTGPGQLKHHYMPDAALVILRDQELNEELLDSLSAHLKSLPDEHQGVKLRKPSSLKMGAELELAENAAMAARELYSRLRDVSSTKPDFIYFRRLKIHDTPEWAPVMDRLSKASLVHL